jgi:Ca2+-binding EF-hand superfamily protein
MKSKTLVAAIALSLCAGAAFAQAAPQAERPARANPDTNGDGVIDRAEAAQHPRLARHFDRLDTNGDGRLDASERRHGKGMRGGGHGRGHFDPARLDANGDGRLSRDEVAAAPAGRDGKNRLLENFEAIDANRDGHLTRAELRAWHERQRPQREARMRERFEQRFVEADLNRDGRLSRVEVDEKMPWLSQRFAWLDDNGDGFLSREELRPQRSR